MINVNIFTKSLFAFMVAAFSINCQTTNTGGANQSPNRLNLSNETFQTNAAVNNETDKTGNLIAPQRVVFKSSDKTEIVGSFYQAPSAAASPALLLLHQWGEDRHSFDNFAKRLQANGFSALAIDGRGFGESTKRGGEKIAPERTVKAVFGMRDDVAAAFDFLSRQKSVDANRIGIVGASYGSSLAIIYAAENPKIKSVALLSPGTNYFGNLPTEPAVREYGNRPLLLVAAENDAESASAARLLNNLATGEAHELKIFPRGGHGTGIFAAGVNLDKLLEDFFERSFK